MEQFERQKKMQQLVRLAELVGAVRPKAYPTILNIINDLSNPIEMEPINTEMAKLRKEFRALDEIQMLLEDFSKDLSKEESERVAAELIAREETQKGAQETIDQTRKMAAEWGAVAEAQAAAGEPVVDKTVEGSEATPATIPAGIASAAIPEPIGYIGNVDRGTSTPVYQGQSTPAVEPLNVPGVDATTLADSE